MVSTGRETGRLCCPRRREGPKWSRQAERQGDFVVHGGEKAYWGRGRVGKGGQKSETSKQAPTRKTKAAVDRRQNNRMSRVSVRHCAAREPVWPSGKALGW